jgi:glycosyltransferase involved in cell wall biosynthesis
VGAKNNTEKYYSAFDCFVFPSVFEGFGMVALEAQVNGLNCFCSDCLSNELKITDKLNFLSLESGAEVWADEILSQRYDCEERKIIEIPKEYDICAQRRNIMEILR